MAYESMEQVDLPKKGEKARNNLRAVAKEIEVVGNKLKSISLLFESLQLGLFESLQLGLVPKRRSMIGKVPSRMEFEAAGLKLRFYVDFTLEMAKGGSGQDIVGVMVYGTSRALCYANCFFEKIQKSCQGCDIIGRCDALEDKPLLRFTIDRHGLIKSAELEDEWWVVDPDKDAEVMAVYSDFLESEFTEECCIDRLCSQISEIPSMGKVDANGKPINKLKWLNECLRKPVLYEGVTKKIPEPSHQLTTFKKAYDESQTEDNLIRVNRRLLEEFSPDITPKTSVL